MRIVLSMMLAMLPFLAAPAVQAQGKKAAGKKYAARTQAQQFNALEKAIVQETNALRANPAAYVKLLEERLGRYDGHEYTTKTGKLMLTNEGTSAVREAIQTLDEAEPVGTLTRVRGLDRAAGVLSADQRLGRTGHVGSNGSQPYERVSLHYKWDLVTVENIHYGGQDAREIILDLLIDDGVGNRGHREALLNAKVEVTGVSCGPHERYQTVCVMEYAVPERAYRY